MIAWYSRAIELDGNYAWAYMGRGIALTYTGHVEGAMRDSNRAIALDPSLPGSYTARARVWVQQRVWEKAVEDFTVAIDHCPGYTDAYLMRAACDKYPGALHDLNTYIDILPGCATGYERRAWCLIGKGDYDGALRDANRVVQICLDSISYALRGNVYVRMGQYDVALQDLNAAIALDPNNVNAIESRIQIWWAKKDWPNAVSDLNKEMTLRPNDPRVYNSRALVFIQMKSYDKAWEDVHTLQKLQMKVDDGLLRLLKKESGRDE